MSAIIEPASADDKESRRRERDARRFDEESGRMEPEVRFRALVSVLKMETEFLDLADKKARFALMIMSALNAIVLVLVMRGGSDVLPAGGPWGLAIRGEFTLYAATTVYYIWQAIESLRPRGKLGRPTSALPSEIVPGSSMRVLFHTDIVMRDRETFGRIWDHLRLDNLTTELADQLYMVSRINVKKYEALARLYQGVGVMTALLTLLMLTAGAYRLLQ